jgi:ATP-dependent Clp protease ATP-binding subunit ClpC
VQGTPGTGKSESAALLARLLEIPYVNIDAASMPDYHTAASQLLGSGRGIVMSHLPGRLEQVAKHHAGAVVEVSDLDHAPARVRAPLADLFLQLLETGEAQSATGAGFSCVNLILVFSMNLPGGADEEVRKAIGFGGPPAEEQVLRNVMREIKLAFSGAFLSRVGRPILFAPLGREDLAAILERTLAKALAAGAERLGWGRPAVELDPGLGTRLAGALPREEDSLGARAVHEQGRLLAAQALSRLSQKKSPDQLQRLRAGCGPRGELELNAE